MQTFQLTPEQFEERKLEVGRATGEVLPAGDAGHRGTISKSGVTIDYKYDPLTQKLAVEITHKPFVATTHYVESEISKWFGA